MKLTKCCKCEDVLDDTLFERYTNHKGKTKRRLVCNDCHINNIHPRNRTEELYKPVNRNRKSFNYIEYKIKPEDYNRIYDNQKGRCKICDIPQSELKRSLSIDHCHKTGRVRGLLCQDCNLMLGLAKDRIEILRKSIVYLNVDKEKDYVFNVF